ncbi:MAG: lipopolysaccharide biosynthesis protein [Chitinispirillaceae bacterium]|nr:lipopolysaccharide biosynthesis protein [Chitinispirillaceae bacterium]
MSEKKSSASFQHKIVKNVSWLVLFRLISQTASWFATIYIARILIPEDYGLMGMATLITGYAEIFAEMGLGSAIIQRKEVTQKELSTLFGFTLILGIVLALLCVPVAHLTAYIMKEPRLVPLTSTVAFIFLFSSIRIVPFNLLRKRISFKLLGIVEIISTLISVVIMVIMARAGFGVWTLVWGRIIKAGIHTLLTFFSCNWWPRIHFSIQELKDYLSFGTVVMFGSSVFYVYSNIAVFFAGRAWPAAMVGLYDFGKELANIPASKVLPLVREVSYPVFARLKDDNLPEFVRFFVRVTKIMAFIFFPVYIAGALLARELTLVMLEKKWENVTGIFTYFCIFQIMVVLTKINGDCLRAQGKPKYELYFYGILTIILGVGYWFSAPGGLVPFLTVRFVISLLAFAIWQVFSMKKIGISWSVFYNSLKTPLYATVFMAAIVLTSKKLLYMATTNMIIVLVVSCLAAGIVYLLSCYYLEKDFYSIVIDYFKKSKKKKSEKEPEPEMAGNV